MTQALKRWMMDDVSLQRLNPEFLTGAGVSASKAGNEIKLVKKLVDIALCTNVN